jgi:hypothetical protein
MHPKPNFKPHSRSSSILHYFSYFKAWLELNWPQKLIYIFYSINRMFWYRVWATRFWTRFASSWSHQFEDFKTQPIPQIISYDHGEGVWSINLINYCSDCSNLFSYQKLLLQFSPKPLNLFASSLSLCVLLFVLFSTIYNIWVFIARDHHHHFWFWSSRASSGVLIFKFGPPPFADFLISLFLLNYFSNIILSKLH